MSACTPSAPAALDSGLSRGVTPPLLPTLVMAAILGAASYFCHEPTAVVTPAPVPATAVAAAPASVAEAPFVPASLAFPLQFPQTPVPMIAVAEAEVARPVAAHRATRPARVAAPRREVPRVVAKAPDATPIPSPASAPDRPLPFAAEETTVASSDEGLLPAIALPFAPTIRVVTQASAAAGAFVGAQGASLNAGATSLGSAVSGWVGHLR